MITESKIKTTVRCLAEKSIGEAKKRIRAIYRLENSWLRSPMRSFGFSVVSTGDGDTFDGRLRSRVARYAKILIAGLEKDATREESGANHV